MKARCVVVLAALAGPAAGQSGAPAAASTDAAPYASASQAAASEEIIVRGRRGARLRIEIEQVEDAVYERFNALNSRDELDIVCLNEAPAGSHMPVRECLPQFALTAERRAAQDVLRRMQNDKFAGNSQIHFMRMDQKSEELAAEMQKLAREDDELLRGLQRLATLRETLGDRVGKRR